MKDVCVWVHQHNIIEDGAGVHETSCGEMHSFIEGSIQENNYLFCPFCGKKIKEQ